MDLNKRVLSTIADASLWPSTLDVGRRLQVDLEFRELWQQIFAKVELVVPSGYDRMEAGWTLFDQIRFGALNRVLIAKDAFFKDVKLSASSLDAFNPFLVPLETETPEPTYPPSPLIQVEHALHQPCKYLACPAVLKSPRMQLIDRHLFAPFDVFAEHRCELNECDQPVHTNGEAGV